MSARRHISWKTKYAACLRELLEIPYEHAKLMHEDQVISLGRVDHGILHAVEPIDDHWNLTPRPLKEHAEKSRRDTGIVAKVKRIELDHQEHKARMNIAFRETDEAMKRHSFAGRKIRSRGFEKGIKRKISQRANPWGRR